MLNLKTCSRCKQTLSLDNFHKEPKVKSGLTAKCKQCYRKDHIRKTYGASPELLYTEECECCGVELTQGNKGSNKLVIDHDHSTGKIRGVICHSCNVALGHAKDSIDVLGYLLAYLRNH